jgi:hypothetical protein
VDAIVCGPPPCHAFLHGVGALRGGVDGVWSPPSMHFWRLVVM